MNGSLDDYIANNSKLQNAIHNAMSVLQNHHKIQKKETLKVISQPNTCDNSEDVDKDIDDSNTEELWHGPTSDQSFLPLDAESDEEFNEMYEQLSRDLKTDQTFKNAPPIKPIMFDLRQTLSGRKHDDNNNRMKPQQSGLVHRPRYFRKNKGRGIYSNNNRPGVYSNNKASNNNRNPTLNTPQNRNSNFQNCQQNNNTNAPRPLISIPMTGRCMNCCCDNCVNFSKIFNEGTQQSQNSLSNGNSGNRSDYNQASQQNSNNHQNALGFLGPDQHIQNNRANRNGTRGNGCTTRNVERQQQNRFFQSGGNNGGNMMNQNNNKHVLSANNSLKTTMEGNNIASVLGIPSKDMESVPAMLLWMQLIMQKGVFLKLAD